MKPYGYEHAAIGLPDGRVAGHDTDRLMGILSRFRTGLGLCGRCHARAASTLIGGGEAGALTARCASCAATERQAQPSRATADADRARRLRLAELQTDVLNQQVRRRDAAGPSSRLVGYAIRFDDTFRRPDGFEESVCRGAFADAIARGGLVLCVDHDRSRLLARQSDGTLRLREHGVGVWAEADLSGSAAGRAFLASAGPATVGCSFGFCERTSRVEWTQPPRRGRLLRRVDATELSLLTRPTAAYTRAWLARDTRAARDRGRCERLEAAAAAC